MGDLLKIGSPAAALASRGIGGRGERLGGRHELEPGERKRAEEGDALGLRLVTDTRARRVQYLESSLGNRNARARKIFCATGNIGNKTNRIHG